MTTLAPSNAWPRLGADELVGLMRSMNEVTGRLQATHVALQEQVAGLQRELAEANAQLRRSQSLAALGEMAAGIAHEVRNPLGSIQLFAQMLAEDLADRPAQAQMCDKISRAVEGLDAVVRDVLMFARETRVQCAPVQVGELIDRALETCASLIAAGGVNVRRPSQAELAARIEVDANLIVQALGNLIRNAIEAMTEAGVAPGARVIAISVSRPMRRLAGGRRAQRIVLAIDDAGPGVPPEVVSRMFNPFFTTRRSGTGLGLAIVHRLIDAHGGNVAVDRSPLGGARLEICLPPRARRAAPPDVVTIPVHHQSIIASKEIPA